MSTARVESIDAIRDFRIYLTKFAEMGGRALTDADSDINKTMRWLEGEGQNYWTSAIRKRQEALVKAEEALRHKRLYKDASGSTPSVVEEQKVVKRAKEQLEEAQTKLKNVKHWTRAMQKESTLYRGAVAGFSNDVASGVPSAIAYLSGLIAQLDKYMEVAAAGVGEEAGAGAGAGAVIEASGASMARAADEAGKGAGGGLDPAQLRAGIPSAQAILVAKPIPEKQSLELRCGQLTAEQAEVLAKLTAGGVPGDGERVIISPGVLNATRVLLARLEPSGTGWYLGPVEGPDFGVYNTVTVGDLRSGRPDLEELLRLPFGSMAVVGADGIEGIFNARDEAIFKLD
jgi:hypothetical protein